jgi:hypothetical protein
MPPAHFIPATDIEPIRVSSFRSIVTTTTNQCDPRDRERHERLARAPSIFSTRRPIARLITDESASLAARAAAAANALTGFRKSDLPLCTRFGRPAALFVAASSSSCKSEGPSNGHYRLSIQESRNRTPDRGSAARFVAHREEPIGPQVRFSPTDDCTLRSTPCRLA